MKDIYKELGELSNVDGMARVREAERAAARKEFEEVVVPAVARQEQAKTELIAQARRQGEEERRLARKLGKVKTPAPTTAPRPRKRVKKGKGKGKGKGK